MLANDTLVITPDDLNGIIQALLLLAVSCIALMLTTVFVLGAIWERRERRRAR